MKQMNGYAKTAFFMAGMTGLFMAVGAAIGGTSGATTAFGIAAAINVFAYWKSDKMVLRHYDAQQVTMEDAPEIVSIVEQLSQAAGIPTPKTYIINSAQPNAFATGRNPENAAVAVSTGLLKTLNTQEVAGVIAHELAHIKNRDTLIMTVTATMAGAIGMLANMAMFMGPRDEQGNRNPIAGLLVMIFAPVAATIVQMAISRSREYEADRVGAEISNRPEFLASALEKIAGTAPHIDNHKAEASPATAHMFIINPLHFGGIDGLFSTHPKTEERVRRLRSMTVPKNGPWG
jgi:heat shock protein HtpX